MNSRIVFCAMLAGGAFAAGPFDAPFRGCVRNGGGMQWIYGLRGSFAAADAGVDGVISAACSERYAAVKTESALVLLHRGGGVAHVEPAGGGPAMAAFDERGEPAFAWVAETRTLLRWSGGGWTSAEAAMLAATEDVLAIAAAGDTLLAVRRREGRLWITRWRDGAVIGDDPVPGGADAAALLHDGTTIFAEGATLRIRTPQGTASEMAMEGVIRGLAVMNGGWVAVETDAGRFALEAAAGRMRLYQLAGGAL